MFFLCFFWQLWATQMQLFPCFSNNNRSLFVTPFFRHLTGALTPRHLLYQISFIPEKEAKHLWLTACELGPLCALTTSPWSALLHSTCPAPGWCPSSALMPVFCSGPNSTYQAPGTLVVECWNELSHGWNSHPTALHSCWDMQSVSRELRRGQPAEHLSFIACHDIWNRWAESVTFNFSSPFSFFFFEEVWVR